MRTTEVLFPREGEELMVNSGKDMCLYLSFWNQKLRSQTNFG